MDKNLDQEFQTETGPLFLLHSLMSAAGVAKGEDEWDEDKGGGRGDAHACQNRQNFERLLDVYLLFIIQAAEPPPEPTVSIATTPTSPSSTFPISCSPGEHIDCCHADFVWQARAAREKVMMMMRRRCSGTSSGTYLKGSFGRRNVSACYCRYFRRSV